MPKINYTNPNDTEWISTAPRLWGIPLHPLGEMNKIDYYVAGGSLEQQYKRFKGDKIQVMNCGVLLYIVMYCFISSLKMVIRKPRHLVSWCCFIPSVMSIADTTMFINLELGTNHVNCRHMLWALVSVMSVSNFCNSLILLHRAHLVLGKAKWIIYASVLPLLSQLSFAFVITPISFAIILPGTGCAAYYPPFMPLYWLANALPLNLVFSVIFSYIGWKQYSRYGSDAWKKLTRDGIQVMLLVALCNIFCCLFAVTQVIGINSDIFLATDW
ncbi:hypothetical protein BDF22DRAFT_85234 [Syncephalis plumigaleata]|nr:hypothetical protein BDF22DRAFT_85234 [Syncephalis plumigaleata]